MTVGNVNIVKREGSSLQDVRGTMTMTLTVTVTVSEQQEERGATSLVHERITAPLDEPEVLQRRGSKE